MISQHVQRVALRTVGTAARAANWNNNLSYMLLRASPWAIFEQIMTKKGSKHSLNVFTKFGPARFIFRLGLATFDS